MRLPSLHVVSDHCFLDENDCRPTHDLHKGEPHRFSSVISSRLYFLCPRNGRQFSSSRLICLMTACDERYSSAAALAKLPRSATSKKTSKCLSCIAASPQFARHTMAGIVTPAARIRRRRRSCTARRGPLALGDAGAGVSGEAPMIQERACCHPDR